MDKPCLFCLETIKENIMSNPIGCRCKVSAHQDCFEKWFHEKNQMECPICHAVSIPNRIVHDDIHVVYVHINEENRRVSGNDKAVGFCCCILIAWSISLSILSYVMNR